MEIDLVRGEIILLNKQEQSLEQKKKNEKFQ